MAERKIIGIDPSPSHLGYVGLCAYRGDILKTGFIETSPRNGSFVDRYAIILKELSMTMLSVDNVVMEDYAFAVSQSRSSIVLQAGTVEMIRKLVYDRTGELPVMVRPTVLKKFICGNGKLAKNEVIEAVYVRYGIKFSYTDVAEAYALADYGRLFFGDREAIDQTEEECLAKYRRND